MIFFLPTGFEPVPFCPGDETASGGIEDVSSQFGRSKGKFGSSSMDSGSAPLMAMPMYMQFARSMGGRSYLGRNLPMQGGFGYGMGGMGGMGTGGVGRRLGMSAASGYGGVGGMEYGGMGGMYMV